MQKIPLLLLFVGHVWVDTSQGILPVALVKLKELFSLSYFQVGFIMAVLNLTSSVIQPIFGYISDRFSTGWFVPAGILWTAFAMGLLGWSANYPVAEPSSRPEAISGLPSALWLEVFWYSVSGFTLRLDCWHRECFSV
jgi:MFS family permease